MTIFEKDGDHQAFERVLREAVERTATRLLCYAVLPNHWHLVVWPRTNDELSKFVGWLTLTHTQRWHAHRHSTGSGHVYQGRFKRSWPRYDAGSHVAGRTAGRLTLESTLRSPGRPKKRANGARHLC